MAFTTTQLSTWRSQALKTHNDYRLERNGRTMLTLSSALNNSAQKAAQYQANRNTMTHTPYYCSVYCSGCYGTCSGCNCSKAVGENVAKMYSTNVYEALIGWRKSCAHYYNMVNGGFSLMGLGAANVGSTVYWAVHFAGNHTYCTNGGYCCACAGNPCTQWKNTDPWRR